MDYAKIKRLIQLLEDGALTSEEAADLLETIIFFLEQIRPFIKIWYLRILLDGVRVSVSELKEYIHDQEK